MLEYLDAATKTTVRQAFFGFGLVFMIAVVLNGIGRRLRNVLSSKLGGFYDYLVMPGCMCHEAGRALGCLISGIGIDRFEIFNLKTDDSERIPLAVNVNRRFAFLRRFIILTGPVWFGSVVVCAIATLVAGTEIMPSYSTCFGGETDVGILSYATTLLLQSILMAGNLFLVWHWTSPFCLLVFYLLFCVGSQITISARSMRLIWQSVLGAFLILFTVNLIPGLNAGMAWLGERMMPAVFMLHVILLFVAMLDIAFYVVSRMMFGKGRSRSSMANGGTHAGVHIRIGRHKGARIVGATVLCILILASCGWVGIDVKPVQKTRSDLVAGQSGTYYQLSDSERKELVWMAKAANAAYPGCEKPLGYRSISYDEWKRCAVGCDEVVYTEDGYFNVGSGLRGRLMIHMMNEGRVVLSLSGCDFGQTTEEGLKDLAAAASHYFCGTPAQYRQALKILESVLDLCPRTELWVVGHSLGGSLTTYLALNLPKSGLKVKCATFNGFGISHRFSVATADGELASQRVRNVYCDGDIVFKIPGARHYGPCYSLRSSKNPIDAHGLDGMLELMIAHRTGWKGL